MARIRWSLLVSIVFIVVFSAISWFASPKGPNQTYVFFASQFLTAVLSHQHGCIVEPELMACNSVWRSTLILSAWSCWLMWGMYYS